MSGQDHVPEVLFVCVHNAGRSQMAAALLDHHANGWVRVRSAGSAPAHEVNPAVVAVMAEIGLDLAQQFPKPLTDDAARSADVVITMGCGDACPFYPGKRYEDWQLDDPDGQPIDAVRPIRDEIDRRVRELLQSLVETAPTAPTEPRSCAIACTLDGVQMPDRVAEWEAVLAQVTGRTAVDGGLRLTFDADTSVAALAELARDEHECCRFFAFAITVDERGTALEVRAPDDAQPVVAALFGAP